MNYWANPLCITDAMRRHRINAKVNAVIMMYARDFLRLTLAGSAYSKEDLLARLNYPPETLEQYNEWALDPGITEDGYERAPMGPVTLSICPTENPAMWRVCGHEGRHRVAAMWVAGEDAVEVSLTMNHDRTRSILDLPPIIEGEDFAFSRLKSDYKFNTKGIIEVLETNVQIGSQHPGWGSEMENRRMSREELIETIINPKIIIAIPKQDLLRSLREDFSDLIWKDAFPDMNFMVFIRGTWDSALSGWDEEAMHFRGMRKRELKLYLHRIGYYAKFNDTRGAHQISIHKQL